MEREALFLVFLFSSFTPPAHAQAPPQVVSTIPAADSKGVSTKAGRILVVFDRDMLQNSFSLVKAGPGILPPLAGRPRYLDSRTFSIPLGTLKPGTLYSLGFNSAARKGFQSADNVPLPPFVLTFTTAGGGKTGPAPAAPRERAPRVVRTVPPGGSTGVDPALSKVEIWFSRDMDPRGMSLARLPGRERLGYIPGKRPYFEGGRHLVIPVRLAPGKNYGVGINTGRSKGFVSKEGVPAAPFELSFTTAPAAGKEAQPLEPPAGRWVMKTRSGRIEQWFFPGGEWGLLRIDGKKRVFIHGTWKIRESELLLTGERGKSFSPLLWSAGPQGKLVLKRGPADRRPRTWTPLPFVRGGDLAGTWRTRWGGNNERTWRFCKDGSFTSLTLVLGRRIERKGRWEVKGLKLVVRDQDMGEPEVYGWTLEPSGRLALTMENGVTQFYERLEEEAKNPAAGVPGKERVRTRKEKGESSSPPAEGKAGASPFLGRWIARGEEGSIEIAFLPGGRYRMKIASPDGEEKSRGTWRDQGGVLLVREEGDEETTRVAYRFTGPGRVVLEIEGRKILFTRADRAGAPAAGPLSPGAGGGSRPKALEGTWAAQDMTGAIALTLEAGGAFRFYLRQGLRQTVLEGTWTAGGGTIHLAVLRPREGAYDIPFQGPEGNRLTVTLDGTKVVLVKRP